MLVRSDQLNAAVSAELLALARVGGWHFDVASSRLRLNPEAARVLELDDRGPGDVHVTREELLERIHEADHAGVQARWDAALSGQPYEAAYRFKSASGATLWIWEAARFVFDDEGRVVSAVGVVQDVTGRFVAGLEQSNVDALTGLPNRRLLSEQMAVLMPLARREGRKLAVLFIDLDRFKQVNDVLGHAAGDGLLRQVAGRMRRCLRESDLVARQGGDEFIVVLQQIEQDCDAGLVALKLIETLREPFDLGGCSACVGASIGIALFPDDGTHAESLLHHADMAMYRAKASGRESLSFYDAEMLAAVRERHRLDSELRAALIKKEFVLHYQPIYDIAHGHVHSVEALIRWNHPRLGLVRPQDFVPAAEESGLIREIGRWVVREVCQQMARWEARDFFVAVNVSAVQIPGGLTLEWLQNTFAQTGVDPRRLVFEITESALIRENAEARRWFDDVEKLGVRLSIDDFGTGYASLGFLRAFRLQQLKIDKSFVQTMLSDASQLALVKSIVDIARNMGMTVTAEGVENAQTLTALSGIGCDFAQGFHLSYPLPASELLWQLPPTSPSVANGAPAGTSAGQV